MMLYTNPLYAWASLGLRAAEMLTASAHVIGHRTTRANTPAQLFEMGSEKVQAALEASHAMTRHLMAMQARPSENVLEQWATLLASGMKPFHARALRNARRASRR